MALAVANKGQTFTDGCMGLMYIAEQVSPDNNIVENLKYNNDVSCMFAEFNTILQTFDVLNRNRRKYLAKNVEEMLSTERIQTMLRTNAWYGEMDHPYQAIQDQPLSAERINNIELSRRSHKILRPQMRGNTLYATIQTASGTEAGRGFCNEIIQGLIPSFSARSLAGIQNINGEPYVIMRKLVCYDWVLYPSHHDANMTDKEPKFITKHKAATMLESVGNEYFNEKHIRDIRDMYTEDVLIPLSEILKQVSLDPNVNTIMEAFDLDLSDMIGFDNRMDHVIIKDTDNTIYANISPKTKHDVCDFLSSF